MSEYKKILAIDGGGIKGVFPITVLAEMEKQIDGQIYEYFDLIAGTSTGGIIALGLALGIPAEEILNFYKDYGPKIFSAYKPKECLLSKLFRINSRGTLHDNGELKKSLETVFGEQRIGHCKTRVIIPSFNINAGMIHIYKTSHHNTLRMDYMEKVVDAAMATSAAPIFFPAHEGQDSNVYIDGGIGNNNPTGLAVVEALTKCGWKSSELKVFSIGCTDEIKDLSTKKLTISEKPIFSAASLIGAFFVAQSQYSEGTAKLLIDDSSRYFRINPMQNKGRFELDGVTDNQIKALIGLGKEHARYECSKVIDLFFNEKADVFEPCFFLPAEA